MSLGRCHPVLSALGGKLDDLFGHRLRKGSGSEKTILVGRHARLSVRFGLCGLRISARGSGLIIGIRCTGRLGRLLSLCRVRTHIIGCAGGDEQHGSGPQCTYTNPEIHRRRHWLRFLPFTRICRAPTSPEQQPQRNLPEAQSGSNSGVTTARSPHKKGLSVQHGFGVFIQATGSPRAPCRAQFVTRSAHRAAAGSAAPGPARRRQRTQPGPRPWQCRPTALRWRGSAAAATSSHSKLSGRAERREDAGTSRRRRAQRQIDDGGENPGAQEVHNYSALPGSNSMVSPNASSSASSTPMPAYSTAETTPLSSSAATQNLPSPCSPDSPL